MFLHSLSRIFARFCRVFAHFSSVCGGPFFLFLPLLFLDRFPEVLLVLHLRNLASEDRFRAALEGFAGPDAKVVVEDYPRETHGTIAVPVFHEAMKRLLIGGAAAGR